MFDKAGFTDKINEFMLLNDYTATTLAEAISVSPSTIYNILQNRYKQPDTNVFFKLIEFFGYSAEYMLGFVEFPTDGTSYYPPLRKYGHKLRTLLKQKGETQKAFIENMKISSCLAYKWLSDKTLPSVEYLIKIANYFEISVDTLIERIK